MIAGVPHMRVLKTEKADAWALQPQVLLQAIEEDIENGLVPCFVCVTIGTTSTCAVDPVDLLAPIAKQRGIWCHVDSAYAGTSAMLLEHEELFKGLEYADSFDTNPHKWLLTNFDCSTMWVQDSTHLKQALSLTPEYLRAKANALDYKVR